MYNIMIDIAQLNGLSYAKNQDRIPMTTTY